MCVLVEESVMSGRLSGVKRKRPFLLYDADNTNLYLLRRMHVAWLDSYYPSVGPVFASTTGVR